VRGGNSVGEVGIVERRAVGLREDALSVLRKTAADSIHPSALGQENLNTDGEYAFKAILCCLLMSMESDNHGGPPGNGTAILSGSEVKVFLRKPRAEERQNLLRTPQAKNGGVLAECGGVS
jgi:hypothetical protein